MWYFILTMTEHVFKDGESSLNVETITKNTEYSLAHLSLKGVNRPAVNYGSTTIYHVTSGEGRMCVGREVFRLVPGTIIEVPPYTPYIDMADDVVEMEAFSVPPYDPAKVEYLD
jgi:mannose-6-phosphate isomerase-like protein (cupin superfamily)